MNRFTRFHKIIRNWLPIASISIALPVISYGALLRDVRRLRPVTLARPILGQLCERSLLENIHHLTHAVVNHATFPLWVACMALLFCLPTLWSGFREDDDLMHRTLLLTGSLPVVMQKLFVFFDPQTTPALMEQGIFPWWTLPEARISFFRPLAALTHWIDYQFFPNSPFWMHAHNLLWYSALCALAAWFYRRLMKDRLAAGLAGLLFALNVPHFSGVIAINARNGVMAALFGWLALGFHHHSRQSSSRLAAWLSPLMLALSLLCAESGIATAFYLFAYAVCYEQGSWKKRLLSLLPFAVIILVWRAAYQAMGYGAYGSGFYLDPGREPLRFAMEMIERLPVLLFGQWVMPDPGTYALLSDSARLGYWVFSLLFLILLGWGLLPLLRRDRQARFWALGMGLSVIPVCAVSPATGRHLMFVGWGAIALLVLLTKGFFSQPVWLPSRRFWIIFGRVVCLVLIALHGVVYPIMAWGLPDLFESRLYLSMMNLGDLPDCEGQTIVVVNAPSPGQSIYMLSVRQFRGEPLPARIRVLSPGFTTVTVTRLDTHSLLVKPKNGYLHSPGLSLNKAFDLYPLAHPSFATQYGDGLFRSNAMPLKLGQQVHLEGTTFEVIALTPDGRPAEVKVIFDLPLEDDMFRWLRWDPFNESYDPFIPPAVGETIVIAGPIS